MIEPVKIDPERLAALIDGRLGEAEASALRQQLSLADDETVSAFADAVAVSRELETPAESLPERSAPPAALQARRARRRWLVPAFASAAAAIVVVAIWPTRKPPQGDQPPSSFADAIPAGAPILDGFAWSATRGTGQGDGISERARAVRVGALLTDLELDAVRNAPVAHHATALASLLEGTLAGGPLSAQVRTLASDTTSPLSRTRIADLGQKSIGVVDEHLAIAGAYLEAARVATSAGDTTFFDRASDAPLSALGGSSLLDSATRQAVETLRALIQKRPRDVAAIRDSVSELLKTLAQ